MGIFVDNNFTQIAETCSSEKWLKTDLRRARIWYPEGDLNPHSHNGQRV